MFAKTLQKYGKITCDVIRDWELGLQCSQDFCSQRTLFGIGHALIFRKFGQKTHMVRKGFGKINRKVIFLPFFGKVLAKNRALGK